MSLYRNNIEFLKNAQRGCPGNFYQIKFSPRTLFIEQLVLNNKRSRNSGRA